MHPVDRYEAFVALRDDGMTPAEIAARYAMKPREVDQVLALGALAPVVRDAWRDGLIDAEVAQIFTLVADLAEQDKLFRKLKKQGHVHNEWTVSRAVRGDDDDVAKFVRYIGEEAYAAAGGRITRDLFAEAGDRGSSDVYSDPKLAKELAAKKLGEKINALKADGWSWVELREDVENYWSLGRLPGRKGKFSDADKKKSGVVIEIERNGSLKIEYGVLSASATRSKKTKATKANRKEETGEDEAVSNALSERLSIALTVAAAKAAPATPQVALSLAIAALSVRYGAEVVALKSDGYLSRPHYGTGIDVDEVDDDDDAAEDLTFRDAFDAAMAMSDADRLKRMASLIGQSFSFRDHRNVLADVEGTQTDVAAICAALDGDTLNREIRGMFDSNDYFSGVNGALRVKAVAEAVNADEAAKVGRMKKPEAVAYCVANIPPTGWLPPELRTSHYDGPGAAKAGKAAEKRAAKGATKPAAKTKRK